MRCDQCGETISRDGGVQVTRSVADGLPSLGGQRTHNETMTLCLRCSRKRGKTMWFFMGAIVLFVISLLLIGLLSQ